MIKVLYLPLNVGDSIQKAMYDAWNSTPYVDMKVFDYLNFYYSDRNKKRVNQEFIKAVIDYQPDLVHMQLQMTGVIEPESIKVAKNSLKKKCIFTNWSGDVRNHAAPEMISVSSAVDYTLISSTGQIPLYEQAGAQNVKYWQIGYDQSRFYPLNKKEFKYDLIFAGNAYPASLFADSKKRTDMLLDLKRHYRDRFAIFGTGYGPEYNIGGGSIREAHPNEINSLYNDSRCILSISNYNDISHYFSDRLLLCLASGRPTISYRFPEYESYFSNNSDILIAHSTQDIIDLVEKCKLNSEFANIVGYNGAAKVRAEHTYKSRVIELLKMVGLR